MSNEDPWTIGRLLNWTADYFAKQGIESARLEAEVLLAHCQGCQRIMLYTMFDEPAPELLRNDFRALVRKRVAGTPVAYLVGMREFYSLEFRVTPDVLIPRSETELMVMTLLDYVHERAKLDANGRAKEKRAGEALSIVDMGTGSGVLAVCAAKHLPQAKVTAVDISPAALQVAQSNAEKHVVADRIQFVEGDLFAALPAEATFDFVLSNPPYVSPEEIEGLEPMVRDFEPRLALDGGVNGMEVIERMVAELPRRLRPGGHALIEISPTMVHHAEALLDASPLQRLPTLNDLEGQSRIVQACVASVSGGRE